MFDLPANLLELWDQWRPPDWVSLGASERLKKRQTSESSVKGSASHGSRQGRWHGFAGDEDLHEAQTGRKRT